MEHNINIKVTEEDTRIVNSFSIKSPKTIRQVIDGIERYCALNGINSTITKRSTRSLVDEWCTHNLLYYLHIARSRTADVDLDKARWHTEAVYFILANIYKLIWKQL